MEISDKDAEHEASHFQFDNFFPNGRDNNTRSHLITSYKHSISSEFFSSYYQDADFLPSHGVSKIYFVFVRESAALF